LEETPAPQALAGKVGKKVSVSGWVHDVRLLGGINFVLVRNEKGVVQVTAPKKTVSKEVIDAISALHQEDVVRCTGTVKEAKAAPHGFELIPDSVDMVSQSATPLPLDPRGVTEANLDTRLDWRTLDLRRPSVLAVFKVQDALLEGMEAHLRSKGFLRIFTPSILGGISEGGAEVFKTDYYGKPAFLRQDPQLHRQLSILGGLGKVYDLGPSWRAELSHTPRHMSEHRTIAPELSFIEDERDTMRAEEEMVVAGIKNANEKCAAELDVLQVDLDVPRTPFPEVTFPEVYGTLKGLGHELPADHDLDRESERLLAEHVKEEFDSDFFFINRFPSAVKPFYVMHVDEDPRFARSVDMVYKGLELSSGGQREHRHAKIVEQIEQKGLDPSGLRWFTEPFRYGAPPHGGFSLGVERFTATLLGIENVKEAALFPRDPERLQP